MKTGANLEERREQRDILKALYADYDAKRHDVYVIRYNKELDAAAFAAYCERRRVTPSAFNTGE